MSSWKPEVTTNGIEWSSNVLRFATEDEAKKYVDELMWRWTSVTNTRVVQCDDAVTHRWNADTQKAESLK